MATLKTCFKCKVTKPIDSFYKHPAMLDGRLGKCIACARNDVNENRKKRAEYYRIYDRVRGFRAGPRHKIEARAATKVLEKKPCEVCGSEKVDAHHDDYLKPLDVRWLCRKHHMQVHRKFRDAQESA